MPVDPPPREDRIMVRIIDVRDPPSLRMPDRIEPLARVGTTQDVIYIIECWERGEPAIIDGFRYERYQL